MIKVGDKVRVVKRVDREKGWVNNWVKKWMSVSVKYTLSQKLTSME